jgi:hypothetical protein
MKIIERDTNFSVPIPHVWIGAQQFLQILKDHAGDAVPEIILGELVSPSRIQLLGIKDIEAHLHMVKVPLTANIGTVRINLRQRWGTLACEAQDKDRACNIAARLAPYQPKSLVLTRDSVFYAALIGVFAIPFLLPDGTTAGLAFFEQLLAAGMVITGALAVRHFVARNRIFPDAQET